MGRAERLQVFAVEDTSLQLTWAALPDGPVTFAAADTKVTVSGGSRPGAVDLAGLPADTRLHVEWEDADGRRRRLDTVRTLPTPPGEEVCRFATVNDLHLGARGFGVVKVFRDPPDVEVPHWLRCAGSALTEAVGWGAQRVVVKGDLTEDAQDDEWDTAGMLLSRLPVPVDVVRGNHDAHGSRQQGWEVLARHGIDMVREVAHRDLPGLRLVLLDTVIDDEHHGRVAHVHDRAVDLARGANGPCFIAMHHYPQRFRLPNTWPPGIPASEAAPFLDAVARVNPRTFISSGHTHRHRRHHHGPLVLTEVGSTKDYPGTWGGYVVHEGGIRQVVRRVAAPDAIGWTEPTRKVLGGAWGAWAAWSRPHRCFTVVWSRR